MSKQKHIIYPYHKILTEQQAAEFYEMEIKFAIYSGFLPKLAKPHRLFIGVKTQIVRWALCE